VAPDTLRRDAALSIIRLSEQLSWEIGRVLAAENLTMPQYNILRILRGAKDASLSCGAIGERLLTPVPDLTRVLDRMEKRGLVKRTRDKQDRRVVRIAILKAGLSVLDRLDAPVRELHKSHFHDLTDRQVEQLLKLSRRAQKNVKD